MNFKLDIKTIDKKSLKVVTIGKKTFFQYNENQNPTKWLKSKLSSKIGVLYKCANTVNANDQFVQLYSNNKTGIGICKNNFYNIISYYTARRCINKNWINMYDQYMIPNEQDPEYQQWCYDCIVFSLFDSQNRNVSIQDGKNEISNQFFFMDKEEIKKLAEKYKYNEMLQHLKEDNENRYVYNIIRDVNLSPDALSILNSVKQLIIQSMEEREEYNNLHPELQLNRWDAGLYQLRSYLNDEYKKEYKQFVNEFKKFKLRLQPLVYKFKFLYEN